MIKLFAGAVSAHNEKEGLTYIGVVPVWARSEEEAKGLLYDKAMEKYPRWGGWTNQAVYASQFDNDIIERAYLSIQGEKNQLTEVG